MFNEETIKRHRRIKSPYLESRSMNAIPFAVGILFLIFLVFFCHLCFASTKNDIKRIRVINTIIGEAEGESFDGKLAIACTIRNRGTLKGCYGENSPRVLEHKYSSKTFIQADKAYEESFNVGKCDFVNGATGWGTQKDLIIFRQSKWWKKMRIVAHVGNHFFYKQVVK